MEEPSQQSGRFIEVLASHLIDEPVRITHPLIRTIVIDKPNQHYYSAITIQEVVVLENISKDKAYVEPISKHEMTSIYPADSALPLSELLWNCGLSMSHGELLFHFKPYHTFRFKQWPKDFFMLWDQAKLASFLSKSPNSIDGLVERTGVSEHEAIGFLNAAFLCIY